jgi:prolyl oligopeptidase
MSTQPPGPSAENDRPDSDSAPPRPERREPAVEAPRSGQVVDGWFAPRTTPTPTSPRPVYPPAPRLDVVEDLHGHHVADPYRWLEQVTVPGHPELPDPRTAAWSQAQAELYAEQAATWPGRERVAGRIRALLGAGTVGVPVWRGPRRFFVRREGSQEHAVLVVAEPGPHGSDSERVLLDPVIIDPSGLTTLDSWQPSLEGDLLAYQLSAGGTEESVLRVMQVATGADVDGPIDRARYSPVAWLPGGGAFFYVRRVDPDGVPEDERQYHRRVYRHTLGTDPNRDQEIFGAGLDLRSYYGVSVSRDGRWLTISAATGTAPRNDVWIADLTEQSEQSQQSQQSQPSEQSEQSQSSEQSQPSQQSQPSEQSQPSQPSEQGPPARLRPVAVGLDARVSTHVGRDGRLYVATDLDAPRGRLAVTTPGNPGPDTWQDLLPHDPEAVLEDFAILDGKDLADAPLLLASWTRHAVSQITVHDLHTGAPLEGDRGRLRLPGVGSVGALVARPEGGHEAWFGYTDHATPPHVYRVDGRDGSVTLWATPPGTVTVPDVVTRQVAYPSADGTTVRMFVIARADTVNDEGVPTRPRPTVLYGYGGFGVPLTPGYSAGILAWVEAGGYYAVANLRGGSEEGEQWHRAGMGPHKQNVFDDFHAAAQRLITGGWTTSAQLAISGGSNGGLLVGAALTQRPDLYAAVVCSAPLLDMVRFERFGLGATWNTEYGSADDPEQLPWLLAYSPYHHLRAGLEYPAVLFTVFDGDTRVDPMHARKMCAALQAATASARPVLLRAEKDVGHGNRAVSRSVALSADTMAFAAAWTGLTLESTAPDPEPGTPSPNTLENTTCE